MRQLALAVATLALCHQASAQSFNIDLDIRAGGYPAGAGVPNQSFGGAADQVGVWNNIQGGGHTTPRALLDLSGTASTVTYVATPSGGGGGSGWNGNDGDHRLLMNDGTVVTVPTFVTFDHLQPGRYKIYTYLADRSGRDVPGDVTVYGADIETKVSGMGGMPGNIFIEGVTHSVHDITLESSALTIQVRTNPEGPPDTTLGGFQIMQTTVPEPSTMVALVLLSFGFTRKQKRFL